MELITKSMHLNFQNPKPQVEIISTKTKRKTRNIPISKCKEFFKQFQFKDNTGNTFPYTIQLNINSELNLEEKAIFHGHTIALHQIKQTITCECGSKIVIIDKKRGEMACPTCGHVYNHISRKKISSI